MRFNEDIHQKVQERIHEKGAKSSPLYLRATDFSVFSSQLNEGSEILYASPAPAYTEAANYIFHKEYEKAIEICLTLLDECYKVDIEHDYIAMVHINLMDAYFKARHTNATYFDLSTHHAKQAMIYGHNTGYAAERLAINLDKENKINQAIQVCDMIIDSSFILDKNGCRTIEDFEKRKRRLLNKNLKVKDINTDRLFTDEELEKACENSEKGLW